MNRLCLIAAACALACAACASDGASSPSQTRTESATVPVENSLRVAVDGAWRSEANRARDAYRHPAQTLAFFGIQPTDSVIEITPGGGWYSEILAPYLRERGSYTAAIVDPQALAPGNSRDYQAKSKATLEQRFAKGPAQFDRARVVAFDPKAPVFGPSAAADAVVTFRNVHNWIGGGSAQGYFRGFYAALKPGGVLGVVEHRARPGTPLERMQSSGYLTEALVIELARNAGFVLEEASQINANPNDSTDHPNGVWTLPPSNRHDAEDDAKYRAIGESDRMTLRFRKPR